MGAPLCVSVALTKGPAVPRFLGAVGFHDSWGVKSKVSNAMPRYVVGDSEKGLRSQ